MTQRVLATTVQQTKTMQTNWNCCLAALYKTAIVFNGTQRVQRSTGCHSAIQIKGLKPVPVDLHAMKTSMTPLRV